MKSMIWLKKLIPILSIFIVSHTTAQNTSETTLHTRTIQDLKSKNFIINDTSGVAIPLNSLLIPGKAVVINFWATWCSPCMKELPHLSKLLSRYGKENLTMIAITLEKREAISSKMQRVLKRKNITVPIYYGDPNFYYFINGDSNTIAFPRLFIYRSNGTLNKKFTKWYGNQSIAAQTEAIKELIPENVKHVNN